MSSNLVTARGDACRRPTRLERVGNRLRGPLASLPFRAAVRAFYHRALLVGSGGRGLKASLPDGDVIRLLPEFRHVGFNPAECRAFKEAAQPGGVALDIGANVGHYTVLLGQRVGPAGRVVAFEPAEQTFRGLVGHLRLNGLDDIATPVCTAVADYEGEADFVTNVPSGLAHLLTTADGTGTQTQRVAVVTVDEYCAREGLAPTFIKVDVEGAELEVLRGARRTIAAGGEKLAVFVEMHPRIWPALGRGRADLEQELALQGLRAESLVQTRDPWILEGVCMRIVRR